MSAPTLKLLAATAVLSLCLSACSKDEPPLDPVVLTLARERVAAFAAKDERTQAREALAPIVARKDAALEDLLRAAAIEVGDNRTDAARAFLVRAAQVAPSSPAVAFMRGQLAREAGDTKTALEELRKAHAGAPSDLPTMIILGAVEDDLDHAAEAEKLYREALKAGLENGQQWYVAAVQRLANLLYRSGRDAEAEPLMRVRADLEKSGMQAPRPLQMLLGELGRVRPPTPQGSVAAPATKLAFSAQPAVLPELGGATVLLARDLDDDLSIDLLAYGQRGVTAAFRRGATWLVVPIATGACEVAVPFDADNDGDLDVLVQQSGKLRLYEQKDAGFSATPIQFPALPTAANAIVATDYDHEGDLDLVLAGAFGARVWRRDGTQELVKPEPVEQSGGAVFTDATAESGLPTNGAFDWCISEDFDGDNDVDYLFGGAGPIYLADSLRGGRFAEKKGVFDRTSQFRPFVADLDGDAKPDLWIPGEPSTFVPQSGASRKSAPASIGGAQRLGAADFDLDGALDLAWVDAHGTVRVLQAAGLAAERALDTKISATGPLCAADFDGDGRPDLATSEPDGVHVVHDDGPAGQGVRVSLRGGRMVANARDNNAGRDNSRGVGAIVELRAGPIYRRTYWRGEPLNLGIGAQKKLDVLRVTWPDGVSVTDLDLDPNAVNENKRSIFDHMPEPSGLVGSCPFLYTWDGKQNVFVTDVLGITPLGLQMEPGMFVPPDHDEYVLVKGEQLAPRDGALEMQVTEELREVTYLDHARVLVLDHPADTEVFPNELFTFPPFPAPHVHTVKHALAPLHATGSDGKDWTAQLSTIDDRHAVPFTLQPPQFAGLAHPWFLELTFDKEAVAHAKKMRLLMTGWFFWSDASANMASARNPETAFVPPILQVPDGQGGWRDAGPPIGFPAGKTKTMVIDVASILDKDDPRIRISTTLRLYWDALRLAVDDDDAPVTTHELACTSAKLWRRGFSTPLDPAVAPGMATANDLPERFDWNVIAAMPRWDQHPGKYTRYGECEELVRTVDDRFVILGAGDALTLRFDAKDLQAPAPGLRRDYFVYLDGWAKDRDPNTVDALEVEPLPFHAMSGYPYRADEHFPDDAAHVQWRKDWNTRDGWRWIRPVAPALEAEWLRAQPGR